MIDTIKKELNISIISSIVYIILGIIIFKNPETMLHSISIAIALLAIIYGLIMTIINMSKIEDSTNLTFGILLIVVGISLLIYPNSLSILISLIIGIWFISSSVSRLRLAAMIKDTDEFNWKIILIISIITLLIGISFVFTPLASAIALARITGVLMIIYSVCDISEIVFIKKNITAIQNILK